MGNNMITLADTSYNAIVSVYEAVNNMEESLTPKEAKSFVDYIINNLKHNAETSPDQKEQLLVSLANMLHKGNANSVLVANTIKEVMVSHDNLFDEEQEVELSSEPEEKQDLRPKSSEDIAQIIKAARERRGLIKGGRYISAETTESILESTDKANLAIETSKMEVKANKAVAKGQKVKRKSIAESLKTAEAERKAEVAARTAEKKIEVETLKEEDNIDRQKQQLKAKKGVRDVVNSIGSGVKLAGGVVGGGFRLLGKAAKLVIDLGEKGLDKAISKVRGEEESMEAE